MFDFEKKTSFSEAFLVVVIVVVVVVAADDVVVAGSSPVFCSVNGLIFAAKR
jgi:hypothetical protein